MKEKIKINITGYETTFKKAEVGAYILKHTASGKVYYGSTIDIHRRVIEHRGDLSRLEHNNPELQSLAKISGELTLEFIPTENISEAKDIEQRFINSGSKETMLNVATDVFNFGSLRKIPEVAAKLSKAKIGNKNGLGYTHSEEAKKQMSMRRIGNKYALNHKHTEETRKKMSESHTGKSHTPETIRKSAESRTRRNVIIDSVKYLNASVAAKALGLSREGVIRRCKSKNFTEYSFIEVNKK